MKRKITRTGQASTPEGRRIGAAKFRVTGPCVETGVRVVREIECTRQEAETLVLKKEA